MTKIDKMFDVSLSAVEDIGNIVFKSISKKPCFVASKQKTFCFSLMLNVTLFYFLSFAKNFDIIKTQIINV
tara:strand:+ start:868 stop:1080 length:213 start_codon:yes stop_codon:yes gene_type:complete